MQVPVVTTERVVLRAHRREDFDAVLAMWSDPLVVPYIGQGVAMTENQVWEKILRMRGMWAVLGFGFWAIEEKATGRLIGEIGFLDRRRAQPNLKDPECGWALASEAHGKGFASEALKAVLAWGDANLGPRTICTIVTENAPSIRLAEKFGYKRFGEEASNGRPVLVFERVV
jgi:RimJ/RimL family protein N-acetyltransferase